MTREPVTVWWLYGPPCAGKSTAAWLLHTHLLRGTPRAHLDVDQVGMCYPAPADDPERWHLEVGGVSAVVRRFAAAGARTVVVSGVLAPGSFAEVADALPEFEVSFCRVRTGPVELRRRLEARYDRDAVDQAVGEARTLDEAPDQNPVVEAGADPQRTARAALDALRRTHPTVGTGQPPGIDPAPGTPGKALLVCGPRAVGKSTAGFGCFLEGLATVRGAYLDVQQLAFLADVPPRAPHATAAEAVAELWAGYRAVGAQTLVLSGSVAGPDDVARYRTALGDTPLVVVRLGAGRRALRHRVGARSRGGGPVLAGDTLTGLDGLEIDRVVGSALAEQDRLRHGHVGDVVLTTDDLSPAEVVQRLSRLLE